MEFKQVKTMMANYITKVFHDTNAKIFYADIDKEELWNLYLSSFPDGTNPIYRERTVYDCNCCKQFLRTIGSAVVIDENLEIHTIFEFYDQVNTYFRPVMMALDQYVRSRAITDIYLHYARKIGTDTTRELREDGTVHTYEHFYAELPSSCVSGPIGIAAKKGQARDSKNVLKRSLDGFSMEAIDIVLELIQSNTLYKGEEWRGLLQSFRQTKEEYDTLPDEKKDLYAWRRSTEATDAFNRIRNHSIGVLLIDISEGMDLDSAVRRYEKVVAPTNYKRPKAIYTKKMLEEAKETITNLGYMDSLPRRYATLDDITVNNILFSNRDAAKRISGDVFDEMMEEVPVKKFSKVEEIPVEKFVSDILPTAKELEVYLENRHSQNMVSLIAPANKEAPSMFKWDNSFGWAYSGNITDSDIRENVKNAGGNVDGVLRFSIQWNDGERSNHNDFDAHCITPDRDHIYFGHKRAGISGGFLDVDIIHPLYGVPAVENIAWPDKNRMRYGDYNFFVHNYTNRGGKDGFKAEIEFDGQIYRFDYQKHVGQGEKIIIATVTLHRDGSFTIKEYLNSQLTSREVWGLKTNAFVPVTVAMYSPNYWDDQSGIGHRHYFFMLKDCVNPEQPNGFYNEFLKNDLEKHKRVFEALGGKMAVQETEDQLSGLGFSSTKRNDVIVRVTGSTKRVMKIKF